MAKLEFKIKANKQPVDELYKSVDRFQQLMRNFKPTDSGFEEWVKRLAEYPKKLKESADEIEKIKAKIASFNNWDDKKGLDKLAKLLETSKDKYDLLAQKTVDTFNELQSSTNRASAELLSSQKNVDSITWKLIDQKKVVADLQSEIRRLNETYRSADKENKPLISAQITSKKKQLEDERVSLNNLRAEQERARLTVKGLKDEMSGYDRAISNLTNAQEKNEISLKKLLATFGGITAVKSFISDMVQVRGEFQKTQMAFETMLGSKEKADMLMSQMVQTAAKTPFDLQGVANGAKQLLAYGTAAENVNDTLVRLGNIASGLSIPLEDLVYLYGTTQTQGRLFTQDVRQFMGRGIPLVKELASLLGKTEEEINKMVTAGQIGFTEVEKVIKKMTDEGGLFYNLMEKQSQTLSGQISNLGDAWDQMLNSIGEDTQGVASATISMATGVVENYERVGKVLVPLIALYGVHKAAIIAVSVATNGLTMAENLLYLKSEALVKINKLLNATMLSNPYVLLATIVASFTATMWVLHDSTTAVEKAQKQLNKEQEEAAHRKQELTSKTDSLISKINSETESVYSQVKAYKELIKLFPELGNVSLEEFKNLPQDQQNKMLSSVNEKREIDNAVKAYEADLKRIEDLKKKIQETESSPYNKSGNSWIHDVERLNKQLDTANNLAKLHKEEIDKIKEAQWEANTPVEEKVKHYEDVKRKLIEERDELDKTLTESEDIASVWVGVPDIISSIRLDALNKQIDETTGKINSLTRNSISVVQNKSYWEKQKQDAEAARNALDVSKKNSEDWSKYTKQIQEAQTQIDKYSDSTKREKQEKKEADKQLKQQKTIHNELLSLRRQNQQSEIDLMKEGSDKKIAQINLDYDNEITAILAKEKEWKDAQGGKLSKEQTVEIHTALVNSYVKREQSTSNVNKEQLEEEKRAMNEYLKEYGSYQKKRQAITAIYNEKIAKATTKWERLSLAEGMKKELADVDNEAQKSTSIITRLFDDMSKKNITSIRAIADEAEKFLSFLERGEYSSDNSFGITEEQFDVLRKSPDQLKAIKDEIANVRREADQMETSFNKVSNGLKKVFASENDARKLKEGLAEIEEGMNEIMQAGQFLSDTFSKLGDSFGGVFSGIAEGFSVAMDTVSSAMNGAKAGAMFGPIGASAGAAIGVVTSLAGAIARIHDKKNEKRIQRLQDQIAALDKSYEKLDKSIQKAYSNDASQLIDQQNTLLEQQKVLIQQQIREEQDKKKTDKDRIKEWQNQIDEINEAIAENKEKAKDAIFGEDLKSAIDNFASAQAEAWAAGEDRAESAKEAVKKTMRQMVTESIKAATESSGAMEKIRDKLKEFYADNVLSGWEQDYIYNMAEELQKEIDRQFGWAD
ncbi:tape measure protein, partial [Parabacteroides merdae]|uniref:tape measure protein n=1 Tax=Parabacteroides merdae TaxID=46503 RepID=UPI001E5BEFBC